MVGVPRGAGRRRHGRSSLLFPRFVGAVEIRGIYKSGMGPYFPRVRRKCISLMGLYPPMTALWSSNQSAISQRIEVFSLCGAVSTRGSSVFFPGWWNFRWNDLWTADGTLSSRGGAGSTCEPWPIRDRPVGLGFPHRAAGINPDDIRVRPRVVGVVGV